MKACILAFVAGAMSIAFRGNNGVILLGAIELQIFDSYTTKIYLDSSLAAALSQVAHDKLQDQ